MLNATTLVPERFRYDELVIPPGELPVDATASLYLSEFNVVEMIELAAEQRPSKALSRIHTHTIGRGLTGTTYIPLPERVRSAVPGLLNLQLPAGVSDGQHFTLDVQQYSGQTYRIAGR